MALTKVQKVQLVELVLGGKSLKNTASLFDITHARVRQIIDSEVSILQSLTDKDYGSNIVDLRSRATEIMLDLKKNVTGGLLKVRKQQNEILINSNLDNLSEVPVKALFDDNSIINSLMKEEVFTLHDLTNVSELNLKKTSGIGRLKIKTINRTR
jgi:hypothetical protein